MFVAREAIKRAYRFVQAPVWKDYIIAPTTDLSKLSPQALDDYIRNGAGPSLHFVGTAAMSPKGAGYGVVDPDLLVKGVRGVRIIDNSILVRRSFYSRQEEANLRAPARRSQRTHSSSCVRCWRARRRLD
jgi:choline dehydrogenase-like flavoprotein